MTTTVTEKGQITIPAQLRQKFGLSRGSPCVFMARGNELVLIPLKKTMSISDYQELFKQSLKGTDDFLAYKRQEKELEL